MSAGIRMMSGLSLLAFCLFLGLALLGPAHAAEAPAAPEKARPEAQIRVMNRVVATLHADLIGLPPRSRATTAEQRIDEMLASTGPLQVSTQTRAEGTVVMIDGAMMFGITPGDAAEATPESAAADAKRAAAVLQQVIEESRELRNTRAMLRAAGVVALATALLAGLVWGLRRTHKAAEAWLADKTLAQAERLRVAGVQLIKSERLIWVERLALRLLFWVVLLLLVYEWLSVSLGQFPFTRAWAEQLNSFLFGLLGRFALAIVQAVPDLVAAVLIFVLAHFFNRMLRSFFAKVQSSEVTLTWLDADVAPVTARLCTTAVWLFALAMAYPYLPGSQTDAFKGVSVLLGLMISLGASNLVGQAASGLILTYTHTYRNGEYVRIAENEGTVMSLGTFTTRIRTGLGEELTISNSQVLGAVTKNYSRAVKGSGFMVDTTVTIGYDTPWRQVHALLVQAALRTEGVLADPPPHVFQTGLSDFYPEYRLVCQAIPSEPRPRAVVMSELHANIQDLFNEYGVQIMSPHYFADPATAKVVAANQLYAAPAKPPQRPAASMDSPG